MLLFFLLDACCGHMDWFYSGVRAIMYRRDGTWNCKGLGYKGWNDSSFNHIFNHGVNGDKQCTPFVADILGDGGQLTLL